MIIEERKPEEVTHFRSIRVAPEGVSVMNPAFDITPLKYVTSVICEEGVFSPEELQKIAKNKDPEQKLE